jgi:hypothetical protein
MSTVIQHVIVNDEDRGPRRCMELLGNSDARLLGDLVIAMPGFWEKGEEVDVGVNSPLCVNEQGRMPT